MIAAIYARKSTEQTGTADEQKSVTRQIDHAREYAQRNGWAVAEDHVYVDDGISGAEFANRPGFVRLMNALKPRAPFQVLVMSEESRLGREAIETSYALKQIVTAGVRCFFYIENRERTLGTPTDKFMMSLTAFTDELEREKARQRTSDAMARKARAGHVCGGRVFGYDNIEMPGADGKRSHVERRINVAEAAIVLRIFTLSAQGVGLTTTAKTLNDEAAPSPRAQQARPKGWAPSSVREVLHRTLYRGEITWNRTQKRNQWGQVDQKPRPSAEWMSIAAPNLRIVSDELWKQVHERLEQQRGAYLRINKGRLQGRPERGSEAKYLLSGLARCTCCGGSMAVKTRSHGKRRAFFYGCTSFHKRGNAVCRNSMDAPMLGVKGADTTVLTAIEQDILRPEIITATLRKAMAKLRPSAEAAQARRTDLEKRLAAVMREIDNLTTAIAAGGDLAALVQAVKDRQQQRDTMTREAAALEQAGRQIDWTKAERELRAKLDDWKGLLHRQVPQARQILKKLLRGPIQFTPVREAGERYYTFKAPIALDRLIAGTIGATMVASPTGFEPVFWP
jgi:site-specific DNA recombinase